MQAEAIEDIKTGMTVNVKLVNGRYLAYPIRAELPDAALFVARRDIAEGEMIDLVMSSAGTRMMVAGEDIEPGQVVHLDADGKVRRMPEAPLSQADEDRIQRIALEEGLDPDLVRRIARNLQALEAFRIMGLAKSDQD